MPTIHAARERVSGPTAAVASLHAGEKLSLDTGGQVHPVLLDAPNETVVWEQADQDLPTAREAHALAFDSARGKVVLFGGRGTDLKDRNDTWEWDGNAWKELHPTSSPPPRSYHSLAYDGARGKVVLFGGSGNGNRLDDTWEWDGTDWTPRSPASKPSARERHSLAYDGARETTVLFGGYASVGHLNDTWEWDGTAWTLRTPPSIPPARSEHALVYDGARGKVVLFGGLGSFGVHHGDTWEWDGTDWVERNPASAPPARQGHSLTYDTARERVVLFGGTAAGSNALDDTWEWDGSDWVERRPTAVPSARQGHALTYDGTRGRVVLVGGIASARLLDDTWEYHAFGNACSTDDECNTGHCVDGVCCDRACDGQCEACDIEGSVGTCSLVTSGQPHGTRDACTGSGTCQGACDGSSATACAYPGNDVSCGEDFCEGGKEIHNPVCDGAGACVASNEVDCGLYACGTTECLTMCTSDDDCAGGASCVSGSCELADSDAGTDGGDEIDGGSDTEGGDEVDAGDDAGANPSPVDGGDADTGAPSDPATEAPAEASDEACSCRTVGGKEQSGHAPWLGVGLAVAVLWRRGRRAEDGARG